ncbi:hypothetical protein GCM10011332_32530 [Terasakiella brassicae]|uniref:Uncharacterized protein n=1 Tax=Terasakiella brassicae TaxID=1634917 RepID=A0A917FFE3_9PROT|nr:hypothetical protein GCM10011332_32530 [Terasakiella brassicae]
MSKLKRRGFVIAHSYDFGRKGKLQDLLFLTKSGFAQLQKAGLVDTEYRYKTPPSLIVDYFHRTAIVDYWIYLERALSNDQIYKLADFYPEFKKLSNGKSITLKAESAAGEVLQVRNDALFIVQKRQAGTEFLFMLEIDRGTIPITTGYNVVNRIEQNMKIRSNLLTKITKVQNVFDHWQTFINALPPRFHHFEGARVLVLTGAKKRILNIEKRLLIREPYFSLGTFIFQVKEYSKK